MRKFLIQYGYSAGRFRLLTLAQVEIMNHVVITGASSGIGQALTILASRKGLKLSVCGRNPAKLQATITKLVKPDAVYLKVFA